MRKKITPVLLIIGLLSVFGALIVRAQDIETDSPTPQEVNEMAQNLPPDEFYKARVTHVVREDVDEDPFIPASDQFVQTVRVEFLNGSEKGMTKELVYYPGAIDSENKLQPGDLVMVMKTYGVDQPSYAITDRHRLNQVGYIVASFFVLVILLSGMMGFRSLAGLAFSIAIIIFFMVPQLLAGKNPLIISLVSAAVIAGVSIYLAHGFKLRTSLALISTIITISISIGLAAIAVQWAGLFGLGSEEAFYLQLDKGSINLRGLLLGGIIVGLLGVLDDITTAQAAVVDELKKTDPALPFHELFRRGYSVGKEHISSLINTLALAYVGSSLPLLLLFRQYQQPIHVILNSEIISEEIIRTIVGSIALILAVPITTAIAAYVFSRKTNSHRPS